MSGSTVRRMVDVLRQRGEDSRSAMTIMHGPAGISRPLLYLDRVAYFQRRAERWTEETLAISSVDERLEHPDCQDILAMGPAAIPFALAALEKSPWRWAPVLIQLTGRQPVAAQDFGKADAVRAAWRAWGESRGAQR